MSEPKRGPILLWRVMGVTPAHVHVSVFGGRDQDHRALLGTLAMAPDEWRDIVPHLPGDIEWRGFSEAVEAAANRRMEAGE